MLASGHFTAMGGKGANQAVAAARLGRSVAMMGVVGRDLSGDRMVAALDAAAVDTTFVVRSDDPTGMALITVSRSGDNTIVVSAGANAVADLSHVAAASETVASAAVTMLQLEIPMPAVAAAAEAAGGIVVLNPAPAAWLDRPLLDRVDVLVPNETELGMIAGTKAPAAPEEAAAMASTVAGPGSIVVTMGEVGAVVVDDQGWEHIPTPSVQAVDPTAAGDAFCAGLADGLARGLTVREAARWAVLCGAITVTRYGAQSALPTRLEVETMAGP